MIGVVFPLSALEQCCYNSSQIYSQCVITHYQYGYGIWNFKINRDYAEMPDIQMSSDEH